METIKMYIKNLFQDMPETEAVERAKAQLLEMMEDKYNELKNQGKSENEAIGVVISEFGNIDELKEELGLNRKTATSENSNEKDSENMNVKRISLSDAKEFIEETGKFGLKVATGVIMCILSVVPLILLGGFSENDAEPGMNIALGLIFLFVLISIAVAIFIINGVKYQKYEYLKKEKFILENDANTYVKDLKESYRNTFAVRITVGVMLCIISVIPVVTAGILFEDRGDKFAVSSVAMLLIIIAVAVFILVTTGMKMDCYKQLLQEEEYAPSQKTNSNLVEKIGAVYWPIVVAIFLGWSFLTMDWGRTWIIWPIAGVLFGAVSAICNAFVSDKSERK